MGSREGVVKVAAARAGLSVDEYKHRIATQKRCTICKCWRPHRQFSRDRSRGDGLSAKCRACAYQRKPARLHRSRANPATGRPGPTPHPNRDGDKVQARLRANQAVKRGDWPHPNDVPCVDCGHVYEAGERRHEMDHHLGYAAKHHLSVQVVCTTCHHAREQERHANG